MTGQVKEEIITRIGELGCIINSGKLFFNPKLLKISEFLKEKSTFSYVNVNQSMCKLDLKQNQLAFTYCQIPIVYELKDGDQSISVSYANNKIENINGNALSKEMSADLFSRSGKIKEIRVCFEKSHFLF